MVITVHQDLFGTGQLIKATDPSLGPAACQHSALNAAANRVIFQMGLHKCGSVLQMTPDSLVYSTNLYYNSSAENNPFILRTDPAVIPIECCYPSWSPVEGTSNICSCCAIGTVGHLKDNPEDVSLCIDPGREMSSSHYQHSRNFPENKTRVTQMDHRV
ncbi:zona pellucida sperm-binding protein 3-like isoform X3 [Dermochelys coriacea]|uniref:zona pellucida sperm-binding protein 3-like isoform X3 n=1 Tax=Dermochelys coriacea TaxID=27794 RepID=UPI001CA86D5C|nr:zona pellucida sperm-binding protein 3-like isoform X3 [Dermochelys coriacea]